MKPEVDRTSEASDKFPHLLPGTFVQVGDGGQQPGPIPMLEVEQRVEAPVQVVGEVGDLAPHLLGVGGLQPEPSLRTGPPPVPAVAIARTGAKPSPLSVPFPFSDGDGAGKGWRY